jgi:hypothetical protein
VLLYPLRRCSQQLAYIIYTLKWHIWISKFRFAKPRFFVELAIGRSCVFSGLRPKQSDSIVELARHPERALRVAFRPETTAIRIDDFEEGKEVSAVSNSWQLRLETVVSARHPFVFVIVPSPF